MRFLFVATQEFCEFFVTGFIARNPQTWLATLGQILA